MIGVCALDHGLEKVHAHGKGPCAKVWDVHERWLCMVHDTNEKQEASDWVESVSCHAWRLGFCMVDGTLIPLASKPGHFGEQFFDCKSNYSLSLMVCLIPHVWISCPNIPLACNIIKPLNYQLCAWPTW